MTGKGRSEGRWMALDVGTKTIGIAVSDPLRIVARPLTTLPRSSLTEDCRAVLELCQTHGISRLVVGRPRHMDGRPSSIEEQIQKFVASLTESIEIPVFWQDERLSSRQAEEWMADAGIPLTERRGRRDEFAAAVILQWHIQEGALL